MVFILKEAQGKTRTRWNAPVIPCISGIFLVVLSKIRKTELCISGFLSSKRLREKTRTRRNAPDIPRMSGIFPLFFFYFEKQNCIYPDFYPQRLQEKNWTRQNALVSPHIPEYFQSFFIHCAGNNINLQRKNIIF